jgi:type III pantothenate kinase
VSLLVIDIGNTTTRIGSWNKGLVRALSVHSTQETLRQLRPASPLSEIGRASISSRAPVAISSVVPQAEDLWLKWCARWHHPAFVIHGDTPAPLANRYRDPAQLGPDRLAAAVGAWRRLGAPVIAVSLGTATVVDAVSPRNEFLGGAIAPGLGTGLRALAASTARLPEVTPKAPASIIGRDTEDGLLSGAVLGTAALVEGLVARIRLVVGNSAPVALTGGHAGLVSPHLGLAHQVFPNLILEGIGSIWEHNQGQRDAHR